MVDRAAFLARGWGAVGGPGGAPLLAGDAVVTLQGAFDALVDEDVRRARYPDRQACLRVCQRWPQVWRRHAAFQDLLDVGGLQAAAGALLGCASVRLLFLDMVVKAPRSTLHVPWHQDLPQWAVRVDAAQRAPAGALLWIALDEVDPSTGGLRYLRGGHHEASPPDAEVDVLERMAPGQAIAHDPRAWHATGPNRTDRWRRACLAAFVTPGLARRDGRPWGAEQPELGVVVG